MCRSWISHYFNLLFQSIFNNYIITAVPRGFTRGGYNVPTYFPPLSSLESTPGWLTSTGTAFLGPVCHSLPDLQEPLTYLHRVCQTASALEVPSPHFSVHLN